MYQLAHHRQLAQICLLSVKPSALMRTPLTRLASSLMAKSQDETQASAEQPASTQASAAQPATTLQIFESLELLRSKQSGKFSTFKVIICYPWKDSYDYLWEGKPRETTVFRCQLVHADNHTEYCNGEYKLTAKNKSQFDKHVKLYKHGTTVVLKAVSLVDDAKTQYNSCSVRVTVNMASTTLSMVS
jgi:hypothetical protein